MHGFVDNVMCCTERIGLQCLNYVQTLRPFLHLASIHCCLKYVIVASSKKTEALCAMKDDAEMTAAKKNTSRRNSLKRIIKFLPKEHEIAEK